jgi:ribosome biogenesis protein ERB1
LCDVQIRRLVYAIKKGWIKLEEEKKKEPQFYLIWDEPTPETTKQRQHIPPPKMKLPGNLLNPNYLHTHFLFFLLKYLSFELKRILLFLLFLCAGHAESYNPPEEYLFDKAELETWKLMDPEDRPLDFIPQKYTIQTVFSLLSLSLSLSLTFFIRSLCYSIIDLHSKSEFTF